MGPRSTEGRPARVFPGFGLAADRSNRCDRADESRRRRRPGGWIREPLGNEENAEAALSHSSRRWPAVVSDRILDGINSDEGMMMTSCCMSGTAMPALDQEKNGPHP